MNFNAILIMCLAALAGGITQSVTGFGAGIVMMIFIPTFLSVTQGAAVSSMITLILEVALVWTYRKSIRLRLVVRPLIFYMICSGIAIRISAGKDMSILKLIFGIFLILLSLYFLFLNGKLKVKGGWLSAGVCGTLSGTASGLFGIGGPPMVVYFMAVIGMDKQVYLGTIQTFFMITGLYNTLLRIFSGIITVDLLPYTLAGLAGILAGKVIGTKIVSRINVGLMTKLVYIVLGLSGIINVISCLNL